MTPSSRITGMMEKARCPQLGGLRGNLIGWMDQVHTCQRNTVFRPASWSVYLRTWKHPIGGKERSPRIRQHVPFRDEGRKCVLEDTEAPDWAKGTAPKDMVAGTLS